MQETNYKLREDKKQLVTLLTCLKHNQTVIAQVLGITEKTLRKHYKEELIKGKQLRKETTPPVWKDIKAKSSYVSYGWDTVLPPLD